MRIGFAQIVFLFTLLSLSGCATVVKEEQRSSQRDAPFVINGRVAIKHDGERTSSGLRWEHHANEDEILLLAPLGQTVARIHRDVHGVSLEESGKRYVAQSMEMLTQQVLGWELPLSGLRYWVTAAAAPSHAADIQRNPNGQIKEMRQDGWDISYSRYANDSASSLPLRLTLRREHLKIMMLIDAWEKQ